MYATPKDDGSDKAVAPTVFREVPRYTVPARTAVLYHPIAASSLLSYSCATLELHSDDTLTHSFVHSFCLFHNCRGILFILAKTSHFDDF